MLVVMLRNKKLCSNKKDGEFTHFIFLPNKKMYGFNMTIFDI